MKEENLFIYYKKFVIDFYGIKFIVDTPFDMSDFPKLFELYLKGEIWEGIAKSK